MLKYVDKLTPYITVCHTHSIYLSKCQVNTAKNVDIIRQIVLSHERVIDVGSDLKCIYIAFEVSKGAKIRNRYNQVPHLTQDTNGKVKNSQLDTTNESQEVSPFPVGDHKAHINRLAQRHSKHKSEKTHKISTKEVPPWNG